MSSSKDLAPKKHFVLRADGWFHTSDVRAVAALHGENNLILSASRDATATLLEVPPATKDDFVVRQTFIGHTNFVNFIFFHPGVELLGGKACIVSGSNDHHVVLWDPETAAVWAVLDGHAHGVCHGTFVNSPDASHGDIVTGDWGGVCHVFDHATGKIKLSYAQHGTAIRGIAHLPTTRLVVSASGDKSLRVWEVHTGVTRQVFREHEDVVQCVCAINATVFASGSNDCTVRLWKLGQEGALCVLRGHDSLIYSLAYSSLTEEVFSASEDHTVVVWSVAAIAAGKNSTGKSERPLQYSPVEVIRHPCVVWGLAVLTATGDLATGGSDGCVRLWTRNDAFIANPEKIELLNEAISAQTVDIKLTQLDTGSSGANSALDNVKVVSMETMHQQRGRYEGEKLFVKDEAGQVGVYMWGSDQWGKVGTVVAGPDQTAYTGGPVAREKKSYKGKLYDYLFDVDVEGSMLKLGYNIGDNILETAKRFINEHPGVVSQDSHEEIQNFLLAHVSPNDLQQAFDVGGSSAPRTAGVVPSENSTRAYKADPSEPSYGTSDVSVAPYTCPEVFSKFNAKEAQQKVNEFLQKSVPSHLASSSDSFHQLMDSTQQLSTLSDEGICLFGKRLCELGHILPEGCRFPLLDAVRFLFYQVLTHPEAVASMPTAVGVLLNTFGVLLSCPGGILVEEKAVMNDAEMLVSLRLVCNALAVLVKSPYDISSANKGILVIATKRLAMLALQKLSNGNIKSSLVSLFVNTSLYLPTVAKRRLLSKENDGGEDDNANSHTEAQLAVLFVSITAKFLLCEPIGSAHILHVLRALYTLFHTIKSSQQEYQQHKARHQKVEPIWLDEACKMGRSALHYTLNSIKTGSNAEVKPITEKLMLILDL